MFTSQTEILFQAFPAEISYGTIALSDKTVYDFVKWLEIQKLLEEDVSAGSTTVNGWQYAFKSGDNQPSWHANIVSQFKSQELCESSWIVDYEIGGHQTPHFHRNSKSTLIINIVGKSDLLLFDSYMNEYPKTLNPGDWIHIPGWLMHASQPCKEKRSILVIDYKK
jgi:hypothetical protein